MALFLLGVSASEFIESNIPARRARLGKKKKRKKEGKKRTPSHLKLFMFFHI